ncbi:hypothetical protein [Variovorax sp. J22R115]|uniref:hypothetical protein n=1 Tax=Variovorax sp. J22R115 TaxID=3053509 RepID=UPI002577FCC4|nr:hypothetical protein [Variovorax sp. J22R115]MDM0051803.1 hypothetical protein [Variovorax sp. J22R115]
MNIVWSYVAMGLLTAAAAAVVAGGEPAIAELRLVEAATAAGVSAVGFLAAPQAVTSIGKTPAID